MHGASERVTQMIGQRKKSVYIIDNDKDGLFSLIKILSPDYIVNTVKNIRESDEFAEMFFPDIILLGTPVLEANGFSIINNLRKTKKMWNVPVALLADGAEDVNLEKGLASGAADFITKPYIPAVVKLKLQNLICFSERLTQQKLMAQITHNFLTDMRPDLLYTETLRIVGEFMDIAQILLYKYENDGNTLVCVKEWIKHGGGLFSNIGVKLELKDPVIKLIKNMMSISEGYYCLHSNDPVFKEAMRQYHKNFNNYILTPVYNKRTLCAVLDFSREDDGRDWNESEISFAVFLSGIFSGVFERDAVKYETMMK